MDVELQHSMDLCDDEEDDEDSSGCGDDVAGAPARGACVGTEYDQLVAGAMHPVIRKAQLDLASRIAERFGMDRRQLEGMCMDVPRPPSAGPGRQRNGGAQGTTTAGDADGAAVGGKRKPAGQDRSRRNSKRVSKHPSFQIVKKLLDGTDQVLKNLVDVDEANDKLVGKGGTPGSANNELKAALCGADQTLVDLVQNIKHLAGILRCVAGHGARPPPGPRAPSDGRSGRVRRRLTRPSARIVGRPRTAPCTRRTWSRSSRRTSATSRTTTRPCPCSCATSSASPTGARTRRPTG